MVPDAAIMSDEKTVGLKFNFYFLIISRTQMRERIVNRKLAATSATCHMRLVQLAYCRNPAVTKGEAGALMHLLHPDCAVK